MKKSRYNSQAIELESAMELLTKNIEVQGQMEEVSIFKAVGRIVAQDYITQYQSPPFNRSPLDGYAFSSNTYKENNEKIKIAMKIYAGDYITEKLEKGQAARIMTGGMIPEGADCVVREEDTDYGEDFVTIYKSVAPNENVCFAGEDIEKGQLIVAKGTKLRATDISVLAGQGYNMVKVFDVVKVGIISTGSELLSHETAREKPLEGGKIFDSNGPMISARLTELGIESESVTIGDNPELISKKIKEFADKYQAVITTGGVSVGEKDYLPEVIKSLKANILFHGLKMKPGSPMMAAVFRGKPIFALSGNPFAAFATLELLTVPSLLKMSGNNSFEKKQVEAELQIDFKKHSKGRRFIRATISKGGVSIPQNHSSGSIASNRNCNCLIDIPSGSGNLEKGQQVKAVLFSEEGIEPCDKKVDIPVFAVSGFHKTGKTTVLEETIRVLKNNGWNVAVIKHDGHSFEPDVPETDSYKLKKAGADCVTVFSKTLQSIVQNIDIRDELTVSDTEKLIEKVVKQMEVKPDIVLLEGFKGLDFPKLMLEETEVNKEELILKGRELAEKLLRTYKKKEM